MTSSTTAGSPLSDPAVRAGLCDRLMDLRPLTDPYLAVEVARLAHQGGSPAGSSRLDRALTAVIHDRMLHEPAERRVPFLETGSRIVTPLTATHHLAPVEVDALRFVLHLSFEYPGIVGSPMAPLALKSTLDPGYQPVMPPRQILESQRAAGPDGLNTSYLVSQMKGGMSVDMGIGCPLMCAYCYRREGDTVDGYLGTWKPVEFIGADEAVERLLAHPWFTPHVTPVGLHMSTSEAFIPQLWPRTLQALKRMDSLGLTNRVSCITKYGLSDQQIAELEAMRNVDLDINICYAAMPESVEPPNRAKRLDFLRRALQSRLNVLAYYRPIAEGLNTTDAHIRSVWLTFRDVGARVVVLGGLKFSDDHVNSFISYGLPLPAGSFAPGKKLLTADTERRIMAIFDDVYRDVPEADRPAVLKRSSCGRVVVRGRYLPDYNAHHDQPETNCRLRCPLTQHAVCASAPTPASEQVRHLLARMQRPHTRFTIAGGAVTIHDDINPFERTFLRQNLLYPVDTEYQAATKITRTLALTEVAR
ncbi:hypothetical protein E0H26_25330 [Micromonospora zingiberis]|uniref:Radical SAM protein n=1 Tax=Micromonospora zingiberis TaxID=2053011 RepID=A0A4R0G6N9_9ACTN|nr:hypothetical protein [Micromonospora zingiberis]TCB91612.1 hypothetical protein E0H26_25330 [Micromonospora zingiberis]